MCRFGLSPKTWKNWDLMRKKQAKHEPSNERSHILFVVWHLWWFSITSRLVGCVIVFLEGISCGSLRKVCGITKELFGRQRSTVGMRNRRPNLGFFVKGNQPQSMQLVMPHRVPNAIRYFTNFTNFNFQLVHLCSFFGSTSTTGHWCRGASWVLEVGGVAPKS